MNVEFEKEYLAELYEKGKTDDKKHRFQPQIVNGYLKCVKACLLYTSPSPRDRTRSRMPSSA